MDGNVYKNISKRTGGDIYIGVVGPVRTGKSTFIKRFMELLVLPNIVDKNVKNRVIDQLPQSGDGKTITTTEPKFIPEDGVKIVLNNGVQMKVRLVDSVGYLVPGVFGHMENDKTRMVKTPWDDNEVTFETAAEIGTEKVIKDHSTVGIVITSDGSATDIPRNDLLDAERRTILQMKSLGKPFVVILNTKGFSSGETLKMSQNIQGEFQVPVIPCNVQSMSIDDIEVILANILKQFPIAEVNLDLPEYLEALPVNHPIKEELINSVLLWMENIESLEGINESLEMLNACKCVETSRIISTDVGTGKVTLNISMKEGLYYNIIEELMNYPIHNDKELFMILREYADAKREYDQLSNALKDVNEKGYGIVHPKLSQMVLSTPEVFKHGNKYGVRLSAKAPCLHIIKTDVTTEVSPVVGSQGQSEDLARYLMNQFEAEDNQIWDTNLFGKTLEELITEQLQVKLTSVPEALQGKIIRSLQKISDEGKDYFICIIL